MEKPFNIVSLFFGAAVRYPDKVAIFDRNGKEISYADLKQDVQYTAAYFTQKGLVAGDRVLVFVPMSIDLYRIVLALFSIGVTVVFVDQWSDIGRLDNCCKIADCRAFIGHWKAHLLRLFSKEIRHIPIKLGLSYAKEKMSDLYIGNEDDPALITFTTGSTGTPKAAIRSHRFLQEQFKALEEELRANPSDVDMSVLPIVLLINLAVGSTSVIADFNPSNPNGLKVEKILEQLRKHQISRIVASPFFIKKLTHHLAEKGMDLPCLQDVFTGGAPVFQEEARVYLQGLGSHKNIRVVYGSTEAEPISSVSIVELIENELDISSDRGLLVGKPYHGTAVRIIPMGGDVTFDMDEEEFSRLQLAEGEWGEIVVSGAHVLAQYFKNEQALRENKIKIGDTFWHRTGDSGYLQDGLLYLTGRCQTLISVDGKLISPFIFENHIQSLTCVDIGTILNKREGICAFVELKNDTTNNRDLVYDFIKILPYKIIHVKFMKLPRDPRHHSKIEYGKLG